jgi:hypothetical protein
MTTGSALMIVVAVLFAIVVLTLIYRRGRLDPRVRDFNAAEPNADGDAHGAARDATPPDSAPAEIPSDRVGSGRG